MKEGQSVFLKKPSNVAYGANGTFRYKYNVKGRVSFNNAVFGDPLPGVFKYGFVQATDGSENDTHRDYNPKGPNGFSYAGEEGKGLFLKKLSNVAYGANGTFRYKYKVIGYISFDNATFGDPLPGVFKYGFVQKVGKKSDNQPNPEPTPPNPNSRDNERLKSALKRFDTQAIKRLIRKQRSRAAKKKFVNQMLTWNAFQTDGVSIPNGFRSATPWYAIRFRKPETTFAIVKSIVDAGYDINRVDEFNMPLIASVIYAGEMKLTDYVLRKNPKLNVIARGACIEGFTPLLIAISHQQTDLAVKLIRKGAKTNISFSPFEFADSASDTLIALLKKKHLKMDFNYYEKIIKEAEKLKKMDLDWGTADHELIMREAHLTNMQQFLEKNYKEAYRKHKRKRTRFRAIRRPKFRDPRNKPLPGEPMHPLLKIRAVLAKEKR
ncbi:MAG: hypothetical protein AAF518_06530 [Spirochaetota bacterium]